MTTRTASQLWHDADSTLARRMGRMTELAWTPESLVYWSCAGGRLEVLGNHVDNYGGLTHSAVTGQHNILVGARPWGLEAITVVSLGPHARAGAIKLGTPAELMAQRRTDPYRQWTNYVLGVAWALAERGVQLRGADIVIDSTLPQGSGLSSSAALEVAVAQALLAVATETADLDEAYRRTGLTPTDLVVLCRRAENEYVGMPCGLLDQGTVVLGDGGVLLMEYRETDGRPFRAQPLAVQFPGYSFVAGYDPGFPHNLVDGQYAARRLSCDCGLAALREILGRDEHSLRYLSDLTPDDLTPHVLARLNEQLEHPGPVRHVIHEVDRVRRATQAALDGDAGTYGQLMFDSGRSSIWGYGVAEGAPALPKLYNYVVRNADRLGVAGFRTHGGGFNHSTIALVADDQVPAYEAALRELIPSYVTLSSTPGPSAALIAA
jgi:galactokinase